MSKIVALQVKWDTSGQQRPEVMRNGARGGYMGKAYTKKEHDKCKQVAEGSEKHFV